MSQPELTLRAILTGIVIGLILTPCNVYTGLKIGWSFNMSITAALLSFGFWKLMQNLSLAKPWGLLESNINQTTASSAASIISGGLVAPIPALALVSGIELVWYQLVFWVFTVSFFGIWVAYFLLNPFLVRSPLPLPAGVATAEVMKDIFDKGREAILRVYALVVAIFTAGALKLIDQHWLSLPRVSLPFSFASTGIAASKTTTYTMKNLTFFLDPSPLLMGFGVIIGPRIGLSLLFGAIVAWAGFAPWILGNGWVSPGNLTQTASWFATVVEWLLWPGVALMVSTSIASFVLLFVAPSKKSAESHHSLANSEHSSSREYRSTWKTLFGLLIASTLVVVAQMLLFDTPLWVALLSIPLAFALAIVAGRIVGETGIPPIGAIGQVSQLSMGMAAPSNAIINLTTANVAGGAAGQCADLLNDFKTGRLINANPYAQVIAQCFGVLTGSIIGSLAYLVLIPDPQSLLITEAWPAPAVITWKAVAETMNIGLDVIPMHARIAMVIGALIGICFAIIERFCANEKWMKYLPSAPAIGLAFVIPASISITMCFGAMVGVLLQHFAFTWTQRFLIAIASGFVAGESVAGIGSAITQLWG